MGDAGRDAALSTWQRDLYELLDVSPDASAEEIRGAWRFQLQAFHSDRFTQDEDKARAEERCKQINAAYARLRDPQERVCLLYTSPSPRDS